MSYAPGKFESSGPLGALFYAISLEGFSDESVSLEDEGAERFNGPFELDKLCEAWPEECAQLSAEDRASIADAAGAILMNDSQGFVNLNVYSDADHMESAWHECEKMYRYEEELEEQYEDNPRAAKALSFPEGVMTEKEWVERYADRLQEAKISWHSLINRQKWNRMDGDEQARYERQLKKKAEQPEYRAWKGEIFHIISPATYFSAMSGSAKSAPPGPSSGFGHETSADDMRARIAWETWAAAEQRKSGHEALAQGHDLARVSYEDLLAKRHQPNARRSALRPRKGWSGHGEQSPYTRRFKPPKYNYEVQLVDMDDTNMRRYGQGQFPGWTKEDHVQAAKKFNAEAADLHHRHQVAVDAAEAEYGADGPLISGGLREHWPSPVKDEVRRRVRAYQAAKSAAHFHEVMATTRGMAPNGRAQYGYEPGHETYVLKHDGKEVMRGTEGQIWAHMHSHLGYSVEHALRYEGYSIEPAHQANRAVGQESRFRENPVSVSELKAVTKSLTGLESLPSSSVVIERNEKYGVYRDKARYRLWDAVLIRGKWYLNGNWSPLYGDHTPNHHHSLAGGISHDPELLDQLVQMAAESAELENERDAHATEEVRRVAREYDAALAAALDEMCADPDLFPFIPDPEDRDRAADMLWDTNGPYLVLMTLRGEGVGIWEDWVDAGFYTSGHGRESGEEKGRASIDDVERFLESRLGRFADVTGSGELEEAFREAAFETAGEPKMESNARGGSLDEDAAHELELYLDNDQRFSMDSPDGMGRAVLQNQLKHLKKGRYDKELSVKGWLHVVDAAAQQYAKEFGGIWHQIFSPATRRFVAQSMAQEFYRRAQAGEFEHVR